MRGDRTSSIPTVTAYPSPAEFVKTYVDPEQPLLMKGLAKDWPAREKWTREWLREALHDHPHVVDRGIFYISREPALEDDIEMPELVQDIITSDKMMPPSIHWRFWINTKGNRTELHYDTNAENVITAQVRGRKEWVIVSPEKALSAYPFTNFALLKDENKLFRGKDYYKFEMEEGDLLYIPPYWYHRAIGMEEENTNVNWTFTRWHTSVVSAVSKRDMEVLTLLLSLERHKWAFVRNGYAFVMRSMPAIGGIGWGLPDFITSTYKPSGFALVRRVFQEIASIPAALTTIPAIRRYLAKVDRTT